jgi:hypothetical protein
MKANVHFRVPKILPLDTILNPVHTLALSFINIHFNIILPSKPNF